MGTKLHPSTQSGEGVPEVGSTHASCKHPRSSQEALPAALPSLGLTLVVKALNLDDE